MLSKNKLYQLRKEIILNSCFLKDYKNSLYIKEKTACSFFDSYIEYLYELASEDNYEGDINDIINKYDTLNNLYNYYLCYEDDPLIQDNIIASKHINNSDSIVIYDVIYDIDDYVLTGYLYLSGLYITSSRITKNKIYYDDDGNEYFKKDGSIYYIDDFIRVNNKEF